MNLNEIKDLSTKDLNDKIRESKLNYTKMKLDHEISPVENTSVFKVLRKEISQMLTVLREREINENK